MNINYKKTVIKRRIIMKDDINVKISVKNDLDDLKSYIRDLKKLLIIFQLCQFILGFMLSK